MIQRISIAPEYQSFYVTGTASDIEIPLDLDLKGIVANAQCINIPCRYWNEGDTEVTLGRSGELKEIRRRPDFDGLVETPDLKIVLSDAHAPEIMTAPVKDTVTRVRIWLDDPIYPARVVIGLG